MTYLKKLVMKGFKSFARETVIKFDNHDVVIVGPNGSGKSNITDALCFVLGRLSIKSIRAAKAAHLIFSGNKNFKPSNYASVELTFDNEDKKFSLDEKEIIIMRSVNKKGQSIYRINGKNKTRQEVLELLSQAGIDPYGFNIILQGEIQRIVEMSSEERRKIIEEVSGISIYEIRKEKSLRELEKTNEKLKQINTILREKTNYLKNLEYEREQASRFKKLELTVKRCNASIINKNLQEKQKQLNEVLKNIDPKIKVIEKIDNQLSKNKMEIERLNSNINEISKTIQVSSGLEQDSLMEQISSLRQELAGLSARKENFENQTLELDRRKIALGDSIKTTEEEIEKIGKEKGKNKKQELENKKLKLEEYEKLNKEGYLLKYNLSNINEQIIEKEKQIHNFSTEINFILNQIENLEKEIEISGTVESQKKVITDLKNSLEKNKKNIAELEEISLSKEKSLAIESERIKEHEKLKEKLEKLDICPLCKTKITKEHVDEVVSHSNEIISNSKLIISKLEEEIKNSKKMIVKLKDEAYNNANESNKREIAIIKIIAINDKKIQLKRNSNLIESLEKEINVFKEKKKFLEKKIFNTKDTEEKYEMLRLEINELERTEERDLGIEISSKKRELERIRLAIKQIIRDKEEISEELEYIDNDLSEKNQELEEKEEQANLLKKKYQKMLEHKNELQDKVRVLESGLLKEQNEKRIEEGIINNFNIDKAQINAIIDTLKEELKEFIGIEFIESSIQNLKEKLEETDMLLAKIGNVNLRAFEMYDQIKIEYDKIKEKVQQLEKEREEIINIISQIDRKKRKIFLQTLTQINEKFSENFSQLSPKGIVTLEIHDKNEIFNSGLEVIVKVGQGKYFDVSSLSGGEQTLVALSLIFAIQELNPYPFYIFDEIDAALDRRNSEKLAYLLKKHMNRGQYIIITHNDSIISESSSVLYGVSMQDGVSKVLSLEV